MNGPIKGAILEYVSVDTLCNGKIPSRNKRRGGGEQLVT